MDNDFGVDLEEIRRRIESAEVLTVAFPMLRQALVLDLRPSLEEPPLVRIAPMARGPEERIRYLRHARPSLPRPTELTIILWPKLVRSLERLGVLDQLLERVAGAGNSATVQSCQNAWQELQRLESKESAAAIRGDNYHTLWANDMP